MEQMLQKELELSTSEYSRHLETRGKDCLPWKSASKPWHILHAQKPAPTSSLQGPQALCATQPWPPSLFSKTARACGVGVARRGPQP